MTEHEDSRLEAPAGEHRLAQLAAEKLPFFYGWIIVAISFLCVFITGATSFWALPIFVGPMHEDTGWSHTSIFAGLSLYFVVTAIGTMLVGRLADRPGGAARVLLCGVLVGGASLICLRWVTSPLQFILLYGIGVGSGGMTIRLVQATLISKWFIARRGSAIGMSTNGGSISALVMVPIVALVIEHTGWQDAWSFLGIVTMVVLLPCIPFVIRSPEDLGLKPDDGLVPRAGNRRSTQERSYALPEAVRLSSFWLLLSGVLIGNFSLQTHTSIMVPYLEEIGFSSGVAAGALSAYGLATMAMRVFWGNLADKRGVRLAIIAQTTVTAFACIALMQVDGRLLLYPIMAFQGITMGGFPPLQIMVWPEFFGRVHLGSIVGFTQPFATLAGALGPLIAGFLFDHTGTYETALWMLVATWLVTAFVIYLLKPAREVARSPDAVSIERSAG
jgi:MFS family permease